MRIRFKMGKLLVVYFLGVVLEKGKIDIRNEK